MKILKSIGLFVVYPLTMTILGFAAGFGTAYYTKNEASHTQEILYRAQTPDDEEDNVADPGRAASSFQAEAPVRFQEEASGEDVEVASLSERLSVDTKYVLEETDIENQTSVETVWKLPDKYIGMDREQFLEAMDLYAAFPPLSEMERGFVGLEVLSFSKDRVVVQMNYQYVQPGASFYLAVKDNEVVVYLEDKETIYLYTGIFLDSLPDALQLEIMDMLWVEDEESLYDFLEAYSS